MENHPTISMKKNYHMRTLLTHGLFIYFCCFSHSKEPLKIETAIQKIGSRALALMTEPLYGAGEIGHFIAIDAQNLYQSKEGNNSAFWAMLTVEEKAALKRFVDPTNSQAPKQIMEAEDYLFPSDIAAIIDPDGEVDNIQCVRSAVVSGNVCYIMISDAKRMCYQVNSRNSLSFQHSAQCENCKSFPERRRFGNT